MPAPRYKLNGETGQFYAANGGMVCFVPANCLLPNGALDRFAYTKRAWAGINCGAQGSIGSHLFPDSLDPVTPTADALEKFARRGFPATLVES